MFYTEQGHALTNDDIMFVRDNGSRNPCGNTSSATNNTNSNTNNNGANTAIAALVGVTVCSCETLALAALVFVRDACSPERRVIDES